MILLRLISWPYVRKHLLRSGLTIAGIALGVTVFLGMHTANQSALYAFRQTVDRIAGATQLQVWAGEAGFPEEVLEKVQSVPDVRVAAPVIEAVVSTRLAGQGSLLVLGVDMTGDQSLRDYQVQGEQEDVIEDPLLFLAQPDSLIVTREFAARNGLAINSRVPLSTMEGDKQFTVRGIMRSGGLSSAFGGNLAVMDIYAAQQVFGRGRHFDRIDVAVKEGVSVQQVQRAIQAAVGEGFQVEPPEGRVQQFDSVLRVYSLTLNICSLLALFIGMFIIYNSFSIAVAQRRSEIGILRALGASQGQIRALFVGESAVAGLLGSGLGVFSGLLLARAAVAQVSGMLEGIYGITQRANAVAFDPRMLAGAIAIGIVTSILAAWIPARNAARVDPVQALQKGKYQVLSAGENRIRRTMAAVFLVLAGLALIFGRASWLLYAGYLLTIFSALLLAPTLALWLARLLRPVLKWLLPVEGARAADSLIQSPRRTSATVAALMLSLAMVVGLGGLARASYQPIADWVNTALNPDLFVTSSETLADRTYRFPATMGPELEKVEGIAQVQAVRSGRIVFQGGPVMVVAIEAARVAQTVRPRVIAGDRERMYALTAAGQGVILSENMAELHRLALGQTIEIATPSGPLRLPVVGITRDFSDQQGSLLMDRSVFQRYWHDDSVNVFRVYLQPGVSSEVVKQRILERFSGERRLFVLLNQEVKSYILRLTDQWFGITYVQIAIAVLVAILGIVNTLTVSITDRRRELGVLRAVGAMRNQIRHTIWMEALSIGLIGVTLGLLLGAANLYYMLEMTRRDVSGMRFGYEFPGIVAALMLPTILGAAMISALWPAESAVRGSLVEALEYE